MADALIGSAGLVAAVTIALLAPWPADAETQRLSGIVIAGEERVAIFAGEPGAVMLVVREGDSLGTERVAEIDARGVRLEGPAGKRLVTPGDDAHTRAVLVPVVPAPPLIDPYRREHETETDQ